MKKYEISEEELGALIGLVAARTCDDEEFKGNEALTPLFQELSEKVRIFQSINASAQDAISVNLHKIQSVLNSGQPDAGVYSASGTNKPDETHFTNRFV